MTPRRRVEEGENDSHELRPPSVPYGPRSRTNSGCAAARVAKKEVDRPGIRRVSPAAARPPAPAAGPIPDAGSPIAHPEDRILMPLTDPWAWPRGRDASRERDPRARTHAGIASAYPRNAVTPKRLTGPRPGGRARAARRPGLRRLSTSPERRDHDPRASRLRLHAPSRRASRAWTCAGRGLCFPC